MGIEKLLEQENSLRQKQDLLNDEYSQVKKKIEAEVSADFGQFLEQLYQTLPPKHAKISKWKVEYNGQLEYTENNVDITITHIGKKHLGDDYWEGLVLGGRNLPHYLQEHVENVRRSFRPHYPLDISIKIEDVTDYKSFVGP